MENHVNNGLSVKKREFDEEESKASPSKEKVQFILNIHKLLLSIFFKEIEFTYTAEKIVGSGTFGVVYQANCIETGEKVAIKKVFQDKRYKNRELQIIKELSHPNIVHLKSSFLTTGDKGKQTPFLSKINKK